MSTRLPPPLVVAPSDVSAERRADLEVILGDGADRVRAEAFGAVLARSRAARSVLEDRLQIFAADDVTIPPPVAEEGKIWVPHVFFWEPSERPALAWELCDQNGVEGRLGYPLDAVARWAARPQLLLRLLSMAAAGDRSQATGEPDEHLSFRWVLSHEDAAAQMLCSEVVCIDHVSIHLSADDEDRVARLLCDGLGLVEIPRPASITVPGRWLQAGNCRIHLNSRAQRRGEPTFPGTAPNHVCFAVGNLDVAERAVRQAGFQIRRAGSLGHQLWFQLPGDTVIELQPLRGASSLTVGSTSETDGHPPPSQQDSIF